jgi:pyruvate/2-oxoglutarate dehydrogenase complex dihydrolipoamide acyltransferase (E2) component
MSPETIQLAFERAAFAKHRRDIARGVVTSSQENSYFAEANECEMKAKEAMDPSVKRYFARLASDYRHLAKLARRQEL